MAGRGPIACDRCGGKIEQPATGRRRLYCGRTCRELAYRVRKIDRAVTEAVEAERTGAAGRDSSTVATEPIPVTTVVETPPPAGLPRARRRRSTMTGSAMPLGD